MLFTARHNQYHHNSGPKEAQYGFWILPAIATDINEIPIVEHPL